MKDIININEIIGKYIVINCKSYLESLEFRLFLHLNGYTWRTGDDYLNLRTMDIVEDDICQYGHNSLCFNPYLGEYSDKQWYEDNGCEVISFDELNLVEMMKDK